MARSVATLLMFTGSSDEAMNVYATAQLAPVETERLSLRRFSEADAQELFDLDSDPEVMRFLTGGKATPLHVIQSEILPLFCSCHERFPGFGFWAAGEKSTGAFVGWFSLRPEAGRPGVAELGFRIKRAAWGRGYATEGSRALIARGFAQLGVRQVVARTYQDNLASRRVLEKLGMNLVRTFRMTPEELKVTDTFAGSADDLWDGDDLEYAVERPMP